MFKHCLVSTDFADGLQRLTDFIPDLAAGGIKKIVFFHSVPLSKQGQIIREDSEALTSARQRLTPTVERPSPVEVKVEVASGEPTETLPRIMRQEQIDVIILGTPIRSSWQETIFGNTTTAIARATPTPLLILRPQLISTYTKEELALRCQHLWRYLLIPYNDSRAAKYVIERLKEAVKKDTNTTLRQCKLIWVIDPSRSPEITANNVKQAEQKLQAVKEDLETTLPKLQVSWEVTTGEAQTEVLKSAYRDDISAIAIGDYYEGNILQWTVPSFTKEILHRSWFPLLFFSPAANC